MLQISFKSVHFRRSYRRTREHRQIAPQSNSNIRPKPSFEPNNKRHHARFRTDRSNCCKDLAVFRDGGCPPTWICFTRVWTTHECGLCHYAKFGWNRCCSFDNMQFLIFCALGLKVPTDAPKISFLGIRPPNWGAVWTWPAKRHFLARK